MRIAYADPPYIGCAHLLPDTGSVARARASWRGKFVLPEYREIDHG